MAHNVRIPPPHDSMKTGRERYLDDLGRDILVKLKEHELTYLEVQYVLNAIHDLADNSQLI